MGNPTFGGVSRAASSPSSRSSLRAAEHGPRRLAPVPYVPRPAGHDGGGSACQGGVRGHDAHLPWSPAERFTALTLAAPRPSWPVIGISLVVARRPVGRLGVARKPIDRRGPVVPTAPEINMMCCLQIIFPSIPAAQPLPRRRTGTGPCRTAPPGSPPSRPGAPAGGCARL